MKMWSAVMALMIQNHLQMIPDNGHLSSANNQISSRRLGHSSTCRRNGRTPDSTSREYTQLHF